MEFDLSAELRIGASVLPPQGDAKGQMERWADRAQSLEEQLEAEQQKHRASLRAEQSLRSMLAAAAGRRDELQEQLYSLEQEIRACEEIKEQLETYRVALDDIVNAKSYINSAGYVHTADEAQEFAIKRAADLVSDPATGMSDAELLRRVEKHTEPSPASRPS